MSDAEIMHTLIILLAINLAPLIIACLRRHNDTLAIGSSIILLDIGTFAAIPFIILVGIGFLLLLACFIMWFVCLIWSLNSNTRVRDKRVAKYHAQALVTEVKQEGIRARIEPRFDAIEGS